MTEEQQILFDRALANELGNAEQLAFEQQLDSDDELKAAFRLYKSMQQFLNDQVVHGDALNAIRKIHHEETKTPIESNKTPIIRYILLAASVAAGLYLACIAFWPQPYSPPTFAELYKDPTWPTERGNEVNELFYQLLQGDEMAIDKIKSTTSLSAKEKNYWLAEIYTFKRMPDSTLVYISQINDLSASSSRIAYLEALSYFEQKKQKEIKKVLEKHPNINEYYTNLIESMIVH